MSEVIAGNIRQATADHPSIGGLTYEQKSTGENKLDGGGLRTTDDKNGITSAGNLIVVMQNERCQVTLEVALTTDAYKYTVQTASDIVPTTYNFTYRDGSAQKFIGRPVGDIVADKQTGTMTVTIQGNPIKF